jgi:hypothetical protein
MADKTLSLSGMTAEGAGVRRAQDVRPSRFDPPSYYTAVHVAGYSVLTSIAAARNRQRRRVTSQDVRKAAHPASEAAPCANALTPTQSVGAASRAGVLEP